MVCEFPIQRPADVIIPVSVLATSSFKHGKSKTLKIAKGETNYEMIINLENVFLYKKFQHSMTEITN